jgi:hypothetical protein
LSCHTIFPFDFGKLLGVEIDLFLQLVGSETDAVFVVDKLLNLLFELAGR